MMSRVVRLLIAALVLAAVHPSAGAPPGTKFSDGLAPQHWVLLGPLASPGLTHDYLPSLGGEASARFTDGQAVKVTMADGTTTEVITRAAIMESPGAGFTFDTLFPKPTDNRVAYAYAIVRCDRDLSAAAEFGSDDQAVVWLNGREAHRYDGPGRATRLGDDLFPLELKHGANHLLVKVENGYSGWGFALRLVSPASFEQILARKQLAEQVGRGQAAKLVLDREFGFILGDNTFPAIFWDREEALGALYGKLTTSVRWFDSDLNEVEAPTGPGRYGAYVETSTSEGPVLRRSLTVFRAHDGLEYWRSPLPVQWDSLPTFDVTPETWAAHRDEINRWASAALGNQLAMDESGAMLLSALWERDRQRQADPASRVPGWWRPDVVNMEYQLALRAKVLGTAPGKDLAEPRWIEKPAPVLLEGTEEQAGFKPGAVEAIDAVCRGWAEETGVPFNLCVARHGQIILNRGYGRENGLPVTRESRFGIASLSKFQTGILLTQFLDQGLLSMEHPIGRYLTDHPTEGEKVMTLRMCMSHTAGTEGHGNFGGFANPWFDNVVAMGLEAYEPGTRYEYNGLSLNLAGRVMEVVAGRSFVRLMNEQLYAPLGCGKVDVIDSSFGTRIAAQDLAKVAQMLINGGAYGHRRFFAPGAIERLMPVRLGDEIPTLVSAQETRYGLGCTLEFGPFREDVPEDTPEAERSLLGPLLNHGSATGSTMYTGFGNELIIAMSRQATGPDYNERRDTLLRTVAENLAR